MIKFLSTQHRSLTLVVDHKRPEIINGEKYEAPPRFLQFMSGTLMLDETNEDDIRAINDIRRNREYGSFILELDSDDKSPVKRKPGEFPKVAEASSELPSNGGLRPNSGTTSIAGQPPSSGGKAVHK